MADKLFTGKTVQQIAKLSKLTIEEKRSDYFANHFNSTIEEVNKLKKLDTFKVAGTYHVTGLKNVYRKDEVERDRVLSQESALSNSRKVHKGFFVVKSVFDDILHGL